MSGCVLTETVVKTETRAVVPPAYLYKVEPKPVPPADVGPETRVDATLEAYGERGIAIDRANARAEKLEEWAGTALRVYENAAEQSLEDLRKLEGAPGDP